MSGLLDHVRAGLPNVSKQAAGSIDGRLKPAKREEHFLASVDTIVLVVPNGTGSGTRALSGDIVDFGSGCRSAPPPVVKLANGCLDELIVLVSLPNEFTQDECIKPAYLGYLSST